MEHAFTWTSLLPFVPDHTAMATLVALLLVGVAYVARRQLASVADPVVPDGTLTVRNCLEIFTEQIASIVESILGHHGRRYVPLYATFFLYILVANLSGLVPGFSPPTSNLNVTLGLGICSFLLYNYYAFAQQGLAYLKHFVGPVWPLAVLMVPVELVDNFVRPVSLALRLYGNMMGDHLVLEIFTDLTKVVVPVVFYILGAFVSLVQAFIFTLLSVVYLALATAHDH
ncbi:MAG: ATP synthase subunit a [Candidatus Binatia bacterium]|nr:MAG: ATP synthase subunit a [Candidatus Binatia bacterium]